MVRSALWWFSMLGWLGCLGQPAAVGAQSRTIRLVVQVLTVAQQPVGQIAVDVLDAATHQRLAHATTNAAGQAIFPTVPQTAVRVLLQSTSAGTPLHLIGQDRAGIWAQLPDHPWLMDLRVDTDGVVFPDLGSAGAVDGADATAIARGTFGTPLRPTPTSPTAVAPASSPVQRAAVAARPEHVAAAWMAALLLLALAGSVAAGLYLLQHEMGR